MLRWVSISQAAAFNLIAKMFLELQPRQLQGASFPDTLTKGFALGPTGHCGLRPRARLTLSRFDLPGGWEGLRMTPTLVIENFGLGPALYLCP